jgi:quercetin dioxygenase-like cupin family protein
MTNRTGNVYVNPVTRERAAVLVSAEDSKGAFIRVELWAPPGAHPSAPHVHPGQTESFEVLEGRLGVRHGDDVGTAAAGERIEVAPGAIHDWWPEDGRPARVLVEVRPALRFEEAIMTRWGLAAAGRTDARGRPGLLQLALLAQEWSDTLLVASPPARVQKIVAAGLGPLARRRGLRGAYPELEGRILVGRLGEVLTLTGSEPAGLPAVAAAHRSDDTIRPSKDPSPCPRPPASSSKQPINATRATS